MCLLKKFTNKTVIEGREAYEGWKVFYTNGINPYYRQSYSIVYNYNKWYQSKNTDLDIMWGVRSENLNVEKSDETYPNGFHVFLDKEDANNYYNLYSKERIDFDKVCLMKVYFSDILSLGINGSNHYRPLPNGGFTAIADYLYIPQQELVAPTVYYIPPTITKE